jgi:TolB-like protein
MKKLFVLIAVVLAGGSLAFAQATTMPAVQAPVKVLVIPFAQIGNSGGHEWVGSALNESLLTEASGNTALQTVSLDRPLPRSDAGLAASAARGTAASIVVFGAYQYSDNQLRVTGQVVDVDSVRVIGTLKATGALIDLFKIEDSLSSQLHALLPQAPSNLPVVSYGPDQSATAPVYAQSQTADSTNAVQTQPQATYVYPAQQPVYTQPTYIYNSYPSYGYGYGYPYYYGGFPIFIGGGFGRPWGYRPGYRGGIGFVGGGYHGGYRGGFGGGFHGGHR